MIREALPSDIPRIAELGQVFFLEAGWCDVASWCPDSIAETLANLIDSETATLLVAEFGGQVVGMAAALSFPLYFNRHETAAEELFFYVEPTHRTGCGASLLSALETWGRSQGALTFGMKSLELVRPEAVARLYARRGYRATERSYIKRL